MNILQSNADLLTLDPNTYPESLLRLAGEILHALEAEVDPEDRGQHLRRNPVILCDPDIRIAALLESSPFGYEYAERLDLEGMRAFRIGVLLDNDSIAQYLIPEAGLDSETARWLDEITAIGGANNE